MVAAAGQIAIMTNLPLTLFLPDPEATVSLAECLADLVGPGACVLLSGPIGAGKSHFARAFIRHRLGYRGDIPSPTFTLVQSYESTSEEIWHADLYRLTHPDEALELGLDQTFGRAICLIEWPERLGEHAPRDAIRLDFSPVGAGRQVVVHGVDSAIARALKAAGFHD